MTQRYTPGGITVKIGQSQVVEIPARVFRARLDCIHFDTDKSFLLPPSMPGIRNIKSYYDQHPGLTVLVNGHTDLVGSLEWNRDLSLERAKTTAAFLMNQVDPWLAWYDAAIYSKRWSYGEDQHMLHTIVDASGAVYFAGPITGQNDAATQDAARRFQTDVGVKVDGQLGPVTRRKLIERYMALEGTSLPADATLVVHGCGEAHPIDQTEEADETNRRVEIFLFDGPVDPPAQDPCPLGAGCTAYPKWVEQAIDNVDLCRPATLINPRWEAPDDPTTDELAVALFDSRRRLCVNVPATVIVGELRFFGTSDGNGVLRVKLPDTTTATTAKVRYTPSNSSTSVEVEVTIEPGPISDDAAAKKRLANLGYEPDVDLVTAVSRFQRDFGVEPVTGELDAATREKLASVHDEVQ